jgi:mono/diheme cytochrome c family protein
VNCHGQDGRADGVAASALPRPPTNFRAKQPEKQYALRVIESGVAGTAMPQWKTKLNDQQRDLLADYVRGFYAK